MKHTLAIDGVQLSFGHRKILSDVCLSCETGQITGLLGRNGEGKTCLLNVIYGSLEADGESVRIDNIPIVQAFKRSNLQLYLPQFNFMPKSLTLKRIFSDFNIPYADFEAMFPEFKFKYQSSLRHLSGGQRRLVEVYVMIRSSAHFIILDEPFSHIMPMHIKQIHDLLMKEKANKGFILTDHLYRQVISASDKLYILKDGKTNLIKDQSDIETLGYARL